MNDKLLSAQQVADYLGIHVKTLYKVLRENKIALNFIKLQGRMIAFRPSDVERYVNSHEVTRDGSGVKKAKTKKSVALPIMTDEEAQEFFAGITPKSEDAY